MSSLWILVDCKGNGVKTQSCGECPKPTSETDVEKMWNEKWILFFSFWILVTCGDGTTTKSSCGECPNSNCEGENGDCVLTKFTTALNPLSTDNPRQEEFFCTSKYLNHINN